MYTDGTGTSSYVATSEEPSDSVTTSALAFLPNIVTASLAERLVLCLYFGICITFTLCVNCIIIHVTRKTPALHTPQYFFICCYALCDVFHCLTAQMVVLGALIADVSDIPYWLCAIQGIIFGGTFFASSHVLGLVAYERYHWFLHPMTYEAHFTKTRLIVLGVLPHVIGQGFSIFIEIYVGRDFFTTLLLCNSSGPNLVYLNQVVICIFYLPSALMTLVCLVRLILLVKRQQQVIIPLENTNIRVNKNMSIKQAIKIVFLVSGAFWGTSVPPMIARTSIFANGATWEDMDTRRNMAAYVISRTSHFLAITLSSLINPVIYLVIHKQLRQACCKHVPNC